MCSTENVAIDLIQKHLFSVGKNICWQKVTIMALPEMDGILLSSISTQNSIKYNRELSQNHYIQAWDLCLENIGDYEMEGLCSNINWIFINNAT